MVELAIERNLFPMQESLKFFRTLYRRKCQNLTLTVKRFPIQYTVYNAHTICVKEYSRMFQTTV